MTWSTTIWHDFYGDNPTFSGNIQGFGSAASLTKDEIKELILKALDDYLDGKTG